MQDVLTQLSQLRRPTLLMRAARIGAADYNRRAHLGRLMGPATPRSTTHILIELMEQEAMLNALRLNAEAGYNLLRHIDLLIAIVAEANDLRSTLDAAA